MRLQRRSPHWTVRGTRGNKTFQVKTGLSICCLLYHGPLPQEADGKPGTETVWFIVSISWLLLDIIKLVHMDHFKVISHGCDLALFFTCLLVAWTFMMQIITVIRVFFFLTQQASWQSYGDDRSPGTQCSSQKIVWHVTLQHVVFTVLALEVLLSTKNEHFKQKYCKLFFRDHTPPWTTLKWLHIWFETCSLHLILFYLFNFKMAVVVFCLNVVFFLLFYYSLISQCHVCFAGSYLVFCLSCFCVMVVSKQLVGGLGSSPAWS